MSKFKEMKKLVESLGFGKDSVELNYKSSVAKVLINKFGFEVSRLRELTNYNISYYFAEGELTYEAALALVNKMNTDHVQFINTANDNGATLITINLIEGTNKLKYRILLNTITGISTLSKLV